MLRLPAGRNRYLHLCPTITHIWFSACGWMDSFSLELHMTKNIGAPTFKYRQCVQCVMETKHLFSYVAVWILRSNRMSRAIYYFCNSVHLCISMCRPTWKSAWRLLSIRPWSQSIRGLSLLKGLNHRSEWTARGVRRRFNLLWPKKMHVEEVTHKVNTEVLPARQRVCLQHTPRTMSANVPVKASEVVCYVRDWRRNIY